MYKPITNRTIWLTGASSGIGFALAEALLKKGNTLILTARNVASLSVLQTAFPGNVHVLEGDVTDAAAMKALETRLGEISHSIDSVIINAGSCEYIDLDRSNPTIDVGLVQRVTDVNYLGAVRCISIALPFLNQSHKAPHIIGICSAASYQGLPRSEAYGASKAALRHFLQALRLDLSPMNMDVSIVYPGFVDTPLTQKNDFPMPFMMSVDEAVTRIIKQLERRKLEVAFPRRLIWPLKLMSMLPASLGLWMGRKMVRPHRSSLTHAKEVSK